ncbi:MAG: VanZ family protein [Terriglobales bacterium]
MNKTKTFLQYWLPALLWLAVVAAFSTQAFGANRTGGLLVMVLGWVNLELSAEMLGTVHFATRKTAHFVAYGILSTLFFRAFRGPEPRVQWRGAWVLSALAVCLVTAALDEVNQSYTPGRGGSAYDVALDMAGAGFAQLVIWAVYRGRTARR